jgi:hypothetical protein
MSAFNLQSLSTSNAPRSFARDLPLRAFIVICIAAVCGCAGGAGSSTGVPGVSAGAGPQTVAQRVLQSRSGRLATQTLCVGGHQYVATEDDEFSQDKTLNYSPNLIYSTPQPNGAIWSSRALGFASDHSRNNIGTDDAYYTDPTRGLGMYSPYSFANGALNIKAIPVPSPYATASPLLGAHWLSGLLESPAQTYGYVEVKAKEPSILGWFPAALWLVGLAGDDGKGDGYEELDVNEMFGLALPPSTVQQTQSFDHNGDPPSNFVRTVVSPDPMKAFHTYGLLWTPSIVRFFIDRQPTSPAWANQANGPANAIINLGVFTQDTWSPGPANKDPHIMSLQYYRWYQATATNCSPSIIPT